MKKGRPRQKIVDEKKYCSRCKKLLPLRYFSKAKHLSSGYRSHCKKCQKKETYKYVNKPEVIYKKLKARGLLNISQKKFIKWYKRQKKQCVYCKVKEKEIMGQRNNMGQIVYRLEIDRKNNNKGYKERNMILSCPLCNHIKGNYLTYKEMLRIGKLIKEIRIKRKSQRP